MKTDLGADYLRAEDLLQAGQWREYKLTIKDALPPNTEKAADGKLIDKPIITFAETEKRLVLGKTNIRLIKCALGTPKPADWIGKQVTLHPVKGNWFGQTNVAAIRVRIPGEGAKPFMPAKTFGVDLTGTKQ